MEMPILMSLLCLAFSDAPTKKHLKNVYSALAMSMFTAAAGGAVHMYTQFLKVCLVFSASI